MHKLTREEIDAKRAAEQRIRQEWESRFDAVTPAWAESVIVAELERDDCDLVTDYFATSTVRRVVLGFSKHRRDLFGEMRKHAAKFPETEHLSRGKYQYSARVILLTDNPRSNGGAMYAGQHSPWHREESEKAPTCYTEAEIQAWIDAQPQIPPVMDGETELRFGWKIEAEKMEHREKWSMGHGYYLKAGNRYDSGWTVRKTGLGGVFPADLSLVERT